MGRVWTQGEWTVKPGREDDFVRHWNEMAGEALAALDPAGPAYLLRDRERQNVFFSFGPWTSTEEVGRFRVLIAPRLKAMSELLEGFQARVLDEVGERG
jgi:hypothetical protein